MLADLIQAHEQLLAAIFELELLTLEKEPAAGRLAEVRWKLSRASGLRRRLVNLACTSLLVDASPSREKSLRNLMDENMEMLTVSSKHIGRWTVSQITADWDGYRLASAEMRKAMRARIGSEKSILYPLLGLPTH